MRIALLVLLLMGCESVPNKRVQGLSVEASANDDGCRVIIEGDLHATEKPDGDTAASVVEAIKSNATVD